MPIEENTPVREIKLLAYCNFDAEALFSVLSQDSH